MSKFDELNAAHGNVPVSGDVSISLHPSAIVGAGKILAADDNPVGQKIYEHGLRCQSVLYSGLKLIEDAARATTVQHAKPAVDRTGKKIVGVMQEMDDVHKTQLANVMGEAFEAIAQKVQSDLEAVAEYGDKLTETMAAHLKPTKDGPSIAQQASELRRIVAAQPDKMGFLMGACKEGDLEIVQAVLATSPRASGLTKEQWTLLRDEVAPENFCAKEFAALKASKSLHESLIRSVTLFTDRYGKLLPLVKVTPATAAQAALKSAGAA